MRVHDAAFFNRMLDNMDRAQSRLRRYQEQVASGEKFLQPSDDARGYAKASDLSAALTRLQDARGRLESDSRRLDRYDQVLENLGESVRRAREIAQQGANDPSAGSDARKALAEEVDGLINQVLLEANSQEGGQYLLGGSQTDRPPFQATMSGERVASVDYQGDLRFPPIRLPDGQSLNLNLDGESVSKGRGADLFGTLVELRDGLEQSGTDYQALLRKLDAVDQNLLERRTEAGGAAQFTNGLAQATRRRENRLQEEFQAVGGLDMSAAVIQVNLADRDFQFSLAVAGRSGTLSLVDYLR